ncbi:MAG TPA: hypothetical protein VHC44_09635 [Verrucomicrobiae bacterium]|nr:hypothetical protein [Verrucomicrobiae bacterium]
MIKSSRLADLGARFQSLVGSKWIFGLVAAGLVTVAATPPNQQIPDEQYIHIMTLIDRADALRKAGQADAARAKYLDAEKALLAFKAANPLYDPKTVAYRLKEVTDRADTRPPLISPTNSTATSPAKLESETTSAAAKSGVKLLEAGAEPRSVLRYHVKAGDKQTAIMTMKMKLDMANPPAGPDGKPITIPTIPTMSIPMDITVQNVAANGDVTYEMVMEEASLAQDTNTPPEVIQAMQKALAGIKGLTTVGIMSNRGIVKKVDVKSPPNADPQMRQVMDQMKEGTSNLSVPLPDEPVGAGAKWETKKTTKVQTASVEQTGTYELVSVDGDKLSTKFSVGFEATSPKGQGPMAGMQMGGNSTGTANLDLSKAVGPSSEINMHTEMPIGKGQTMKMDINMAIDAR